MPTAAQWKKALQSGACDEALRRLYVSDDPLPQRERCLRLLEQFTRLYGEREEVRIFSAPGRTELGGNHTDHQHGRVLAAAVTLDKLAIGRRLCRCDRFRCSHRFRAVLLGGF